MSFIEFSKNSMVLGVEKYTPCYIIINFIITMMQIFLVSLVIHQFNVFPNIILDVTS